MFDELTRDTRATALAAAAITAAGAADPARAAALAATPEIEVIATAPLEGLGLPRDRIPANVQVAGPLELARDRPASLAELLNDGFASVNVNEAQSNPFQPDVSFRGFTASPLLGNPIGLSVYVDGVRVNEAFGDTVFWDLVPTDAIAAVDLQPGANPVFGLNTLGGALVVHTLNGRAAPGVAGRLLTGSFARRGLTLRAGGTRGDFDGFVSLHGFDEDGWRDHSPSRVRQGFAKLGWQAGGTRVEFAWTHAANRLVGNGLAPESLLARSRDAVYTRPDESRPRLDFANLSLRQELAAGVVLSATVYQRRLRMRTANGDAEFDDGDTPLDGADDAYEAEFRRSTTRSRARGATLQLAWATALAGRDNQLTVGATLDHGRSRFRQFEQAGEFTPDRGVEPAGEAALDTDVAGYNLYRGVYLADTLALGERLHLTVAGRYNHARVRIADRSGTEPKLNGQHRFSRLNPALGATFAVTPATTLYAGYSEGFRVPTPVELTCADPADPCSLPVGFVADPPLQPVVAKSWEAGLRGGAGRLRWNATAYTTTLVDDILFTAVGGSRGFFANVPKTRRQGLEFGVQADVGRLRFTANLAFVAATFRSAAALFNPVAGALDPDQPSTIDVRPGDRLPGVPGRLARVNLDYDLTPRLSLGVNLQHAAAQRLRGDEDNDAAPLGGHTLVNLRGQFELGAGLRAWVKLDNLCNARYATLGAFNRNAFEADGGARAGAGPGPVQRFLSPGAPRSVWLGLDFAFDAD